MLTRTAPHFALCADRLSRGVGHIPITIPRFVAASSMGAIALLLVGVSTPANAFEPPPLSAPIAAIQHLPVQTLTVGGDGSDSTFTRDDYTVTAKVIAPVIAPVVASVVAPRQMEGQAPASKTVAVDDAASAFSSSPGALIQWPLPGGTNVASGFGPRQVSGCGFCSTNHLGLDFTPGSGAPIRAIADGTVVSAQQLAGGLGHHVRIDHVIGGQRVQSVYAHMLAGSTAVAVGQNVAAGQPIGAVGSTGASTGAHLHFEIHLDGVPVDPFSWMQANAG